MVSLLPMVPILLNAVAFASARSCIKPGYGSIALEEHWALPGGDPKVLRSVNSFLVVQLR